jgi:hypothetical protein
MPGNRETALKNLEKARKYRRNFSTEERINRVLRDSTIREKKDLRKYLAEEYFENGDAFSDFQFARIRDPQKALELGYNRTEGLPSQKIKQEISLPNIIITQDMADHLRAFIDLSPDKKKPSEIPPAKKPKKPQALDAQLDPLFNLKK